MSIHIQVRKLSVQKDKLVPIDAENFEVERFKRALIDATFFDDGNSCEAKLIVDLRARTVGFSCDHPKLSPARVGMALMVEFMVFSNEAYIIDTLGKVPGATQGVSYFGIGNDPERFLGFLHHLRKAGKVALVYDG